MAGRNIEKAAQLFRDFNDEDPRFVDTVEIPNFDTLMQIGPLKEVVYHARDGHDYRHIFKRKSRPMLCVTADGLHLVLIGGNYRFTDRGITDF